MKKYVKPVLTDYITTLCQAIHENDLEKFKQNLLSQHDKDLYYLEKEILRKAELDFFKVFNDVYPIQGNILEKIFLSFYSSFYDSSISELRKQGYLSIISYLLFEKNMVLDTNALEINKNYYSFQDKHDDLKKDIKALIEKQTLFLNLQEVLAQKNKIILKKI